MLLGDICTRRCGFCAVPKGRPEPIDWDEPRRVAEAVATLGLKHAVVTSVNRDDDNVGGAKIFAETIREIRELVPDCRIEVLIPDFQGLEEPLRIVLDARPDVLNHNTESVPRLYRVVRSGVRYQRTLDLLENAKKISPAMVTKSGVMVGLGESTEELIEVFRDLGTRGVDILTVGQYLRPSRDHLPIARFYTPEEFRHLREEALASDSGMLSRGRWCVRVTTRTSRLSRRLRRGLRNATMQSLLLVVLGFFAGLLGALTGIGGGVLLTPILALHFGIPIREAIGTSLVAVITTSAASSSVHLQRHTTDIRLGMTLELATSLGAAVMAYLVGYFNRNWLEGLFAGFLLYQFDHDFGAARKN